jgi:hypothetical protein
MGTSDARLCAFLPAFQTKISYHLKDDCLFTTYITNYDLLVRRYLVCFFILTITDI